MDFQSPIGSGLNSGLELDIEGTPYFFAAPVAGLPGFSYVWLSVAPPSATTSNYSIYNDGTHTGINAPSVFLLQISGSSVIAAFSSLFFPTTDDAVALGGSANRWSNLAAYTASFAGPLGGGNNLPLQLAETVGAISTASASVTLSSAQIMTPIIQLNGVTASPSCTITLPNTVGGTWYFDFSGVTIGINSVIFTTGSGTSATVTAALFVGGKTLVTVQVVASNVVSAG